MARPGVLYYLRIAYGYDRRSTDHGAQIGILRVTGGAEVTVVVTGA